MRRHLKVAMARGFSNHLEKRAYLSSLFTGLGRIATRALPAITRMFSGGGSSAAANFGKEIGKQVLVNEATNMIGNTLHKDKPAPLAGSGSGLMIH